MSDNTDMYAVEELSEASSSEVFQNSQDAGLSMEPVYLEFKLSEVKRYYTSGPVPSLHDIVVHVRKHYPNPWQRVCISTDAALSPTDLENMLIFIKGRNEDKMRASLGLSGRIFCPVEASPRTRGSGDYGIRNAISEFTLMYNIKDFEILIYGDDEESLREVRNYIEDHQIPYRVYYPISFLTTIAMMKDGVDIAPYADRARRASDRNEVTVAFLKNLIDEISEEIRSGKNKIQNSEDTRSIYAKWLTATLIHMHQLQPVHLKSYISEYVDLKLGYPFEKLSLYERAKFFKELPSFMGYISRNQEVICMAGILPGGKIYPTPAVLYNFERDCVVTDDTRLLTLDKFELIDSREIFKQSKNPYWMNLSHDEVKRLSTLDYEEDAKWLAKFVEVRRKALAEMAANKIPYCDLFLNLHNTALGIYQGEHYLIYITDEFAMNVAIISDYFSLPVFVVPESEFHRLVGLNIVGSEVFPMTDRYQALVSEGLTQRSTALQVASAFTFKPAIDTFLLMCTELARTNAAQLSYYDRRLRCDKLVMPITTHIDSKFTPKTHLFQHLDFDSFFEDEHAREQLSVCGSLNSFKAVGGKLEITYNSFKGSALL